MKFFFIHNVRSQSKSQDPIYYSMSEQRGTVSTQTCEMAEIRKPVFHAKTFVLPNMYVKNV